MSGSKNNLLNEIEVSRSELGNGRSMKISVELTEFRDEKGKHCEVEMYLDKEGLKHFIQMLKNTLLTTGDHVHLMTPSWGMEDLAEEPFNRKNSIMHHLRVTLT